MLTRTLNPHPTGHAQRGFTLVELMVGLVVGLLVIAAVIAIYLYTVRGSTYYLQSARLNQEARAAMAVMVSDIRRAGFWSNAQTQAPSGTPNPFTVPAADISISNARDCILYTYDRTGAGVVGDGNRFGFRLNGNAVEMWQPVATGITPTCAGNNQHWARLTDPTSVLFTTLAFSTFASRCLNVSKPEDDWTVASDVSIDPACDEPPEDQEPEPNDMLVEFRQISIQIEARASNDPAVTISHSDSVKVRNARILSAP
jgi:prepilin peptidase dependent protein B